MANGSILGTLYLSGHWDSQSLQTSEAAVVEEEPEIEEEPAPPEPPPKPALHSMSKAIYACEQKLQDNTKNKRLAYEVNSVASRFNPDNQVYTIFIDTKTATTYDSPQEWSEVTCEVAAEDLSIIGYKAMKN